ncbi:dehydrogenase [Novosphingobium marinum]|uniref:NAD(P)-dependent dehydrogenase (Short-subunit alcohol dehydrogenase family) n=1 Tax=Novosphingobium marinum TaxID=1514948 RepID=A0A7Y9XUQ7_9SPHN|nr:SDR family NAD(P)-dependent oxidoreductase [Novosphingobium marinum]NYH93750.1 NAD(P)-dependent dehydrogenase (short-subunit alcohol dehydrogenase family) [Novosphingobium marinum]GGC17017.1 dehydrogenase [Novosphingobium marinum]
MSRLEGRVALVTGGLRGIGLATAERLAQDGAKVVVSDLSPESDPTVAEVLGRLGENASYISFNVAEEQGWKDAVATISERYGRLDVLVNNAGIDGTGKIHEMDFAVWRKVQAVNCDAAFLSAKYAYALLKSAGEQTAGGASIINVSSVMGFVSFPESSAYSTSKGGVRLFTKAAALEFATENVPIRVNSVHPGFVETPLLTEGFDRMVERGVAEKAEDLVGLVATSTPMNRLARPEEVAAVIAFLACDDASYVTGSEYVVDGGYLTR